MVSQLQSASETRATSVSICPSCPLSESFPERRFAFALSGTVDLDELNKDYLISGQRLVGRGDVCETPSALTT